MPVSDTKTIQQYYTALVERDSRYLGIFYAAIKTTGIFCLATCRARKPKPENVLFYASAKKALLAGFRPCKVCKPTERHPAVPDEIRAVLEWLHQSPAEKITDHQLRQKGYSPERIRRWFKQHHQMTFQAYQRMLRLNRGYQLLQSGHTVTDSAFSSGYGSLSGFGYSFKQLTGLAPDQARHKNRLYITRLNTPLGPMYAAASDQGLCLLEFTDRRMLETELADLCKRLDAIFIKKQHPLLKQAQRELSEHFDGIRKGFSIPLHTPGTDFQQKVWRKLQDIPYGTTTTYAALAKAIGHPKAVRAVGTANGLNRIAIIVPCHRVIGSDGALRGYGGGLPRKRWLLELEDRHSEQQ